MAHLLRGKQAGISNDFSAGITPDFFRIDDITRLGINSHISQVVYDPVQSLIAIGTNQTKFGHGQVYVFGKSRVCVVFDIKSKSSVKLLQFCGSRLICLDSSNLLSIFYLDIPEDAIKRQTRTAILPAPVNTIHSDPTLNFVLLGTHTGEVLAFDLDPKVAAMVKKFVLPNFWKIQNPHIRMAPIISLQIHPRDIGTLLIGYTEGAVLYSFKQAAPIKSFLYEVPRGAPGGDSDPTSFNQSRWPKLTQAIWHPTGTFILTGHEDSSVVIWDPRDGRVVQARTLTDTNVNKPGAGAATMGSTPGTFAAKEPLFKIAWCANKDPDETCILVSGGSSTTMPTKGLTLVELGRTPNYATSSWQILSSHFENPKRQRILPSPPNAEVIDFCLIPKEGPHHAGAHDPIAMIALLSSGELVTLRYPNGLPLSPTNQLPPSLTMVHPYITSFNLSPMERSRWLGLEEKRERGPPLVRGGTEERHVPKRFENRNVMKTAHADGTIRLWDIGHGDEIENDTLLQADVARAVGRFDGVAISKMSFAGGSVELAAGLRSGEVVVFRWLSNNTPGIEPGPASPNMPGELTDIVDRRDPSLIEGLHPFTLYNSGNGPVTALKTSDVGFLAAGFEGGDVVVIDMRGPAIIYKANASDFSKHDKNRGFRRSSHEKVSRAAWATIMEFSVMTAENDDYSSILLHVGTNNGHVATMKILPGNGGVHIVQYVGAVDLEDQVITIYPMNADLGTPAYASQNAVASLRNGSRVNGVLIAVSQHGARIFRPATQKGANKSWDQAICHSAYVSRFRDLGYALIGLFGDGTAKAYTIPALKEVTSLRLDHIFDTRRLGDAYITSSGDVLGWTAGPSEMALINLWGVGLDLNRSKDVIYNKDITIPARPVISGFEWLSGTQHMTPEELHLLVGVQKPDEPSTSNMPPGTRTGQDRQPSQSRQAVAGAKQTEGWGEYLTRGFDERFEKLNIMGDSMDRLNDSSANFADGVSKYVAKQKRNMVTGAIKGKFGL